MTLENQGQSLRLAYMDIRPAGSDQAETVVLLHGKNFYGSYWQKTIKALTAAGYRVIVPDQIGFGKSAKPDLCYSFDQLAANTAKLLDTLGVQRAAIVGHSMGGMLAVRFARTYPERTTRLILEDPIGLEDYRFFVPPQSTEQLVNIEMNMTCEKYRAFVHRYFREMATRIRNLCGDPLPPGPQRRISPSCQSQRPDLSDDLSTAGAP